MRERRARVSTGVAFSIGLIGLVTLMSRSRFASFHTVDVLQLLASGMCFDVALASAFGGLRGRR
jgi:hypothetical protein